MLALSSRKLSSEVQGSSLQGVRQAAVYLEVRPAGSCGSIRDQATLVQSHMRM